MFFTASGSTFEIGFIRSDWHARQVVASDFDGEVWTPVAGLSSLGRISGEWQVQENLIPGGFAPDQPQIPTIDKVARPALSMQIVAGIVENDAGQEMMMLAEASVDAFAFRLSTPDGSRRQFIALVVAADQTFDEANSVLSWSFSLRLQSNIQRGA
ncbi:hypothetical protein MRBLRH8O_000155 [Agrobacterium radiobacter]|jgi:hypothetical protein|uniref:hypothetical protein n=1 Tax=Agrobacterium radiobacter TaxID=362 RepID=UPI0034655513